MIRLVFMMRRKAGMSLAEFHDYWREEHGPLVSYFQSRLGILRYTQSHRDVLLGGVDSGAPARLARGGMQEPYDGVAEVWFASEAAMVSACSTPAGRAATERLIADEAQFIDLAASPFWLAREHPQVSTQRDRPLARLKTGMVKLHFPIRQLAGMTVAQAQDYWLFQHGPLVRSHAVARGMTCYQQVHRYESDHLEDMRSRRGTLVEPYIGHAEAWFDRLAPRAGPEAEASSLSALEDERNFIDWSQSSVWLSKELLFVDRPWV